MFLVAVARPPKATDGALAAAGSSAQHPWPRPPHSNPAQLQKRGFSQQQARKDIAGGTSASHSQAECPAGFPPARPSSPLLPGWSPCWVPGTFSQPCRPELAPRAMISQRGIGISTVGFPSAPRHTELLTCRLFQLDTERHCAGRGLCWRAGRTGPVWFLSMHYWPCQILRRQVDMAGRSPAQDDAIMISHKPASHRARATPISIG
jgi:hypothetical protein